MTSRLSVDEQTRALDCAAVALADSEPPISDAQADAAARLFLAAERAEQQQELPQAG